MAMGCSVLVLGVFLLCNAFVVGQYDDVFNIEEDVLDPPTVEEDDCECVAYYLCKNNTIIENAGRSLFEVRLNECNGSVEKCCKRPDVIPPGQATTPALAQQRAATRCGQWNPQGVDFTLGGARGGETNFGEFPWVVALLRQEVVQGSERRLNVYECGGSLIHPQVVLTAAHCFESTAVRDMKVRAGEWDTQTTDEPLPHQNRHISEVVIHEDYDNNTMFNDIALVILEQPVTLDQHINVVCLPSRGDNFDLTRCFAGGWGKDVFGKEGRYTAILKKKELSVVPHLRCQSALRSARLGPYFKLHESFICAGGEGGVDTCKGDGGSPLVCPIPNDPEYFKQTGIVCWGLGCGEVGVPGVYVNIAILRDWIDQKMTAKNFGTSSYTYSQ